MVDNTNKRETGSRKLEERPELKRRNPMDTGEREDKPKKPVGLTSPIDQVDDKTRQSDGTDQSRRK